MNFALCIGCLVAVTVLVETTDFPEQQFALEGQSEGYDITRNELDTDDDNSMEDRKGKGYCVPSPFCSKNGYCVEKRKHCKGKVNAHECCGSKKCGCCVPECSAPWKKIPGSGRCYLFSKEVHGVAPRDKNAAQWYCKEQGGRGLASAGYLPLTDADPVLKYVEQNGRGSAWWLSAFKSGSLWKWSDERILSLDSNMWNSNSPSGDGHCVEIFIENNKRSYLNDLHCTAKRDFVCEK